MKKISLLPIAILAVAPVTAFAHKVPYGASHCANTEEQADAEEIPLCAQEEKEKGAATAFCKFTDRPDVEGCAQSIVSHGMAEAAGKCVDEALQKQVDLKDELIGHKKGNSTPSANDGYWHTEYRYSKEDGWHRHDWSPAAKDRAGRENGSTAVRQAKDSSARNKSTTEKSTTTSVYGRFLLALGLKQIGGGVEAETGADHTSTNASSTESGPLSDAKAKEIYDNAYKLGSDNPNVTTVSPDIMCERDEPNCGNSYNAVIPNKDYQPSGRKTGDNSSGSSGHSSGSSSSGNSSSGSQGGSNKTPPKTSSNDIEIEHTPAGSFAGDPSPVTKPGEMLASFDEENLNSPVSRCLLETFKKQVSKDMTTRYDPDGPHMTPEQREKEAQGILRKGICDPNYFGAAYCQKYKTFKLTGGTMQDPLSEKTNLFDDLKSRGHIDLGNPDDFQDKKPIDFSRIPKTFPGSSDSKPILKPRSWN